MAVFHFKQFDIDDHGCGMKICSDSVLLGAWFFSAHKDAQSIADVGAGSGLLAMMAAQLCPDAEINAIELDGSAAEAARSNFSASPWSRRLHLFEGDFASWCPDAPLDIIVSNPPYFSDGAVSNDPARAAARHQNGLSYHTLLAKASQWLSPDGHIGLVSPDNFCQEIIFKAEMCRLKLRRRLDIHTVPSKQATRIWWDFSMRDGDTEYSHINLRDHDGSYSAEYRRLVDDFYTHLKP